MPGQVAPGVVREQYAAHWTAHLDWHLERHPWATLAASAGRERLERAFPQDGRTYAGGRWTARSSTGGRLPGPADVDLWIALCVIYNRVWLQNGQRHPGAFRATTGELLQVTGRKRDGHTDDALVASFERLAGVEIESCGIVTPVFGERTVWRLFTFEYHKASARDWKHHAFDVTLSPEVVRSMDSRKRLLDANCYFAIKGDLARRLYRYLECRRWRGDKPQRQVRLRMEDMVADLPTALEKTGELRAQFRKAHKELIRVGYLAEEPTLVGRIPYGTALQRTDFSYSLRPHPREAK